MSKITKLAEWEQNKKQNKSIDGGREYEKLVTKQKGSEEIIINKNNPVQKM